MDNNEIDANKNVVPVKHQFAKLILATAAGFLASKAAEKVYDTYLNRPNETPVVETE